MAGKDRKKTYIEPGKNKFRKGNPGRPKGTVSKSVHLARRVTAENSEKLLKKSIELALKGDVSLLRMFTDKLLGKNLDAGVKIPVSKSPEEMTAALLEAMQKDGVTADDTAGMTQAVSLHLQAVELTQIIQRIEALEDKK